MKVLGFEALRLFFFFKLNWSLYISIFAFFKSTFLSFILYKDHFQPETKGNLSFPKHIWDSGIFSQNIQC